MQSALGGLLWLAGGSVLVGLWVFLLTHLWWLLFWVVLPLVALYLLAGKEFSS